MSCLRHTEKSPFVEIFKICLDMAHPGQLAPAALPVQEASIGDLERSLWTSAVPQICEKYRLADIHHFSSWSSSQVLKSASKQKFAPNFTEVACAKVLVSGS